jgi:RsiW-degrading membrane proteinase PrsW (M82 family)
MQKYIFKSIAIHLTIAILYLGLSCYGFVVSQSGDPLQIAFIQWAFMICHFGITGFVGVILMFKAEDKKLGRQKLLIGLLVVFLIIILYLCFSGIIWNWLWSFRKDVIQ